MPLPPFLPVITQRWGAGGPVAVYAALKHVKFWHQPVSM
jgi:hypothetical protein